MDTLEIYFNDLDVHAQARVLRFYDLKDDVDGNFDVSPLFILENEEEEEK